MDWSDEAKARLEEEEKRLRLKAANLQERHGAWSLMAKQELVVADDIRAALEMIERLREALLRRGISQAPCDICGYCGPEYYQPTTHRCIGEAYEARRASRSTK